MNEGMMGGLCSDTGNIIAYTFCGWIWSFGNKIYLLNTDGEPFVFCNTASCQTWIHPCTHRKMNASIHFFPHKSTSKSMNRIELSIWKVWIDWFAFIRMFWIEWQLYLVQACFESWKKINGCVPFSVDIHIPNNRLWFIRDKRLVYTLVILFWRVILYSGEIVEKGKVIIAMVMILNTALALMLI